MQQEKGENKFSLTNVLHILNMKYLVLCLKIIRHLIHSLRSLSLNYLTFKEMLI